LTGLYARALAGLPEVRVGDDLAALLVAAIGTERPPQVLADGRVVAIAHKVVSKAEGAVVALADVTPTARAHELAADAADSNPLPGDSSGPGADPRSQGKDPRSRSKNSRSRGKDPRAVQVVLDQSAQVLRAARGVLICRTHHGFVCANAGVDTSNASEPDTLVLLPRDPDASARRLRARLRELTGTTVAVLITDSFGRAWRHGQCDVVIGCAGMSPLEDWRGRTDASGSELRATWLAVADAVAAAADLARAKDSREPVVLIEGLERFLTAEDGPGAAALVRPPGEDLFR
jgi:coenzyme F420-0:L-glutamate ligase/coenzyme F420-1:gamma-L-glutamate ligase